MDVLAEGGHEAGGVLGPHPARLLCLRRCVVDRVVHRLVEDVGLVVHLLHQAQRDGSQGLLLLRVLEEVEHALEQHQELRRVREDLLVLGAVDVGDELQRLVELVVELLSHGDEQVLLALVVGRIAVLVVVQGLDLLQGHPLVLQVLVGRDQQRQHVVDLVKRRIPEDHVHGVVDATCVIEVRRHHRCVDVQHVPRPLLLCVEHHGHHLLDVGLPVEAAPSSRLSDLRDLFDKLLGIVLVGFLIPPEALDLAAGALARLGRPRLLALLFVLRDLVLVQLALGVSLRLGLRRDEPAQHFALAGHVRIRLALGAAVGAAGVGVAVRAASRVAVAVRVAVAAGARRRAARRRRRRARGAAAGSALGVAVIGRLGQLLLRFGLELRGVFLVTIDFGLEDLVALADLRPQGVEGTGLALRERALVAGRLRLLLSREVLFHIGLKVADRFDEHGRGVRGSILLGGHLQLLKDPDHLLVVGSHRAKVGGLHVGHQHLDLRLDQIVFLVRRRAHSALLLDLVLFIRGRLRPTTRSSRCRGRGRGRRRRRVRPSAEAAAQPQPLRACGHVKVRAGG
mmetsp:Transcript_60718/g.163518  ORF Transcript_60718/g.163518 Transcript_60718/m.163518 type:complete len:567 (-) Transcript_60718:779-2479(-)